MTQSISKSKVFILTGPFGGGKTLTALSYLPPEWTEGSVKRLVIDPEMRAASYQSDDDADHPENSAFAFKNICEGKFDPARYVQLAKAAHTKSWASGAPSVVIIDDAALFQEEMFAYWSDKAKAVEIAKIYGLDTRIQQLNQKSWRPSDPGVISLVFKRMFEKFILDLREQNISLIVTSPLHNIWQNFGSREYDDKGQPKMKVLAKSAKVLDVFIKHADVVWMLERLNQETRKMSQLPEVSMDPWNPKQSIPGIPERFSWCGWPTLWQWHRERKHKADVGNLFVPAPEYDPDAIEAAAKAKKVKLYEDLKDTATIAEINQILADVDAPQYTSENHDRIVEYVKRVVSERKTGGTDETGIEK